MLIHKPADVPPSEITPRSLFERRRDFLARSGTGLVETVTRAASIAARIASMRG